MRRDAGSGFRRGLERTGLALGCGCALLAALFVVCGVKLSEPEINGNQYSFELLAGNAQTEGTSECVFTARAGESTQSEAFTIRVESAQETQP